MEIDIFGRRVVSAEIGGSSEAHREIWNANFR